MNRWKDGRETIEDGKYTGRPVIVTHENERAELQEYILEDRRVTAELTDYVGV